MPQGNGIRRSKDLRARFRKFLILTNERKQMSKTTLRKRISLTVVAALTAGVLTSVATSPVANAHGGLPTTASNVNKSTTGYSTVNGSLLVAETNSTNGAAAVGGIAATTAPQFLARSIGLLAKDTSSGVAQTATVLAGGALSLYAPTSATDAGFTATGGSFSASLAAVPAGAYAQDLKTVFLDHSGSTTAVAGVWNAGTTVGTYTISLYVDGGTSGSTISSTSTVANGTLAGRITVSVVAASVGGTYSPVYSVCNTSSATVLPGITATTANVDSASTVTNGNPWYVNFRLADGYQQALDDGNIVVSATNGALVNYSEGSTATAGTGSTVVAYANASTAGSAASGSVIVTQGTANAPVTTTVTISYNGTTVCTKTVSIRGEVAKIAVSDIAVQDLSASTGKTGYPDDGSGRAGLFTVTATDSAGNQVATSTIGSFSADAASLAGQTIVTSMSVDSSASATSSTAAQRYSTGIYTCGATAGEVKTAKIKFTNTGSGTTVTSDAFTLRCADDPYTYTASWDKASYVQGEIATLTVKFLDSKGNAANTIGSTGGWSGVTPMLTPISATGSAPTLDKNGSKTYTYSVGGNTAITAGSYVSVIDFSALTAVAATKQTPSYKVSTGSTDVTFTEVLKSVVALIASINKQIQALQKLILKR